MAQELPLINNTDLVTYLETGAEENLNNLNNYIEKNAIILNKISYRNIDCLQLLLSLLPTNFIFQNIIQVTRFRTFLTKINKNIPEILKTNCNNYLIYLSPILFNMTMIFLRYSIYQYESKDDSIINNYIFTSVGESLNKLVFLENILLDELFITHKCQKRNNVTFEYKNIGISNSSFYNYKYDENKDDLKYEYISCYEEALFDVIKDYNKNESNIKDYNKLLLSIISNKCIKNEQDKPYKKSGVYFLLENIENYNNYLIKNKLTPSDILKADKSKYLFYDKIGTGSRFLSFIILLGVIAIIIYNFNEENLNNMYKNCTFICYDLNYNKTGIPEEYKHLSPPKENRIKKTEDSFKKIIQELFNISPNSCNITVILLDDSQYNIVFPLFSQPETLKSIFKKDTNYNDRCIEYIPLFKKIIGSDIQTPTTDTVYIKGCNLSRFILAESMLDLLKSDIYLKQLKDLLIDKKICMSFNVKEGGNVCNKYNNYKTKYMKYKLKYLELKKTL